MRLNLQVRNWYSLMFLMKTLRQSIAINKLVLLREVSKKMHLYMEMKYGVCVA